MHRFCHIHRTLMMRDHPAREVDIGIAGESDVHALMHLGIDGLVGERSTGRYRLSVCRACAEWSVAERVCVMPGYGYDASGRRRRTGSRARGVPATRPAISFVS